MSSIPPLPHEVYATLTGSVNEQMVQRVFTGFTQAINQKVRTAHLLVHSSGGNIGDGVGIYNFLRNLPIRLIAYNGGLVASIAVILFLAAQERKASASANFVIHKSFHTLPGGTADQLEIHAKGLKIEDERTEGILKQHLKLSRAQWNTHKRGNLMITANDAIKIGLIHEIGDFKPPEGVQLYNV